MDCREGIGTHFRYGVGQVLGLFLFSNWQMTGRGFTIRHQAGERFDA